ncbi:alpha/beta hydrolase family protein [Thermoflavifilum thermophilum]|nr:acetylxylan esterase [Thermoflavifilum thermophilum]
MSISFVCNIGTGYAQTTSVRSYNVLDWNGHQTLHDFITQRLHQQYRHRDSLLHQALLHHQLEQYQQYCRQQYLSILGSMPPKTPLHAQLLSTIAEDGYRIEKIIFESLPHHHVTANLYVPVGKGPFPGILFCCGHEATAKATLTYQQTAILLAQHGFVVLMIDPISQGERYQLTDSSGNPLTRGGTTEHTLLAAGANLLGTSVVKDEMWDNIRAIDYLCSRPEVDSTRIGCIGNSGGGTQTAYLIPLDARIKAAVICSYVTRRERTLWLLGPQDGCQWLPGESEAGLDISDYIIMFAPRPVLILAGRYDFVDFNGTLDVYHELQQVYDTLGASSHISLFAYDDGHGIQPPKQEKAVQWFRKWFMHDDMPVHEKALPTLPADSLQVTITGQVNTAFADEQTLPAMRLSIARSWQASRTHWLHDSSRMQYQNMIKRILHLPESNHFSIDTQQMGTVVIAGYRFQKIIIRGNDFPPIPCLITDPSAFKSFTKWKIMLNQAGKDAVLKDSLYLMKSIRQSCMLLIADLRGMGETADDAAFNDKKYMNQEYRNAVLALFTGFSLPAQRTQDVLMLLNFITQHTSLSSLPIDIEATGPAAEAALLAAALNPHVHQFTLSDMPDSFMDFLLHPATPNQYSYVIPYALTCFDLPDLIQFVGSEKVRITNK